MSYFFDDFFDFFGVPQNIIYNTGHTKDMYPTNWVKTDTGFKATCRTVGINEDDMNIELSNNGYINVYGNSEYEGDRYDISYRIPISQDVLSNIKSIRYKTLNGLTYIYLDVNEKKEKKIKAVKI